jgi:predicted nucleic acid-binding protein
MKFLDSNILIYAVDETQPDKYERACDIVEAAIRGNGFVISAQVLNEFASVMYRKFKKSDEEVKELLSIAGTIKTVPVMPEWTQLAIDIKAQYGLQFYDSLLLAAAQVNNCLEFWSEDLNDGQTYCGIKVVNPFKSETHPTLQAT